MREPSYHPVVHGHGAPMVAVAEFVDGQTKSGNPILTPPHNVWVPVLSNIKTARSWLEQSLFMNGYQIMYRAGTIHGQYLTRLSALVLYCIISHLSTCILHHFTYISHLSCQLPIIICCNDHQLLSVVTTANYHLS